jgi:hypothetical protein
VTLTSTLILTFSVSLPAISKLHPLNAKLLLWNFAKPPPNSKFSKWLHFATLKPSYYSSLAKIAAQISIWLKTLPQLSPSFACGLTAILRLFAS